MTSNPAVAQLPPLEKLESAAHSEVLIADSRWDQARVRAAVEEVFEAHPGLGTVFEPFLGSWTFRSGGGWAWAVEPPGVTVSEARARQRASFDMRIGRLFAVSLIPGSPDRLVITASRLCMDGQSWATVVKELTAACQRLGRDDAKARVACRNKGFFRLLRGSSARTLAHV